MLHGSVQVQNQLKPKMTELSMKEMRRLEKQNKMLKTLVSDTEDNLKRIEQDIEESKADIQMLQDETRLVVEEVREREQKVASGVRKEKFLCPICFDEYGRQAGRVPMIIACGHTMCKDCIGKIHVRRPGWVECPYDRKQCNQVVPNRAILDSLEK